MAAFWVAASERVRAYRIPNQLHYLCKQVHL